MQTMPQLCSLNESTPDSTAALFKKILFHVKNFKIFFDVVTRILQKIEVIY